MAQSIAISAERRQAKPNQVRNQGKVPAVMYGYKMEPISIQVDAQKFSKILSQAGETSLVDVEVEGKKHAVLIREVQYHPMKSTVTHADFYQVRLDQVVRARVPLVVVGEAPAVKDLGGVLVRNLDEIEVEALPKDLPHEIKVDIQGLDAFEKVIRVSELGLPKAVKVLTGLEMVAVLVQAPRSEAELAALEEKVQEDVTAVEGVKEEPKVEAEAEGAAEGSEKAAEEPKKE